MEKNLMVAMYDVSYRGAINIHILGLYDNKENAEEDYYKIIAKDVLEDGTNWKATYSELRFEEVDLNYISNILVWRIEYE